MGSLLHPNHETIYFTPPDFTKPVKLPLGGFETADSLQ
jgi:hypothetical protein